MLETIKKTFRANALLAIFFFFQHSNPQINLFMAEKKSILFWAKIVPRKIMTTWIVYNVLDTDRQNMKPVPFWSSFQGLSIGTRYSSWPLLRRKSRMSENCDQNWSNFSQNKKCKLVRFFQQKRNSTVRILFLYSPFFIRILC